MQKGARFRNDSQRELIIGGHIIMKFAGTPVPDGGTLLIRGEKVIQKIEKQESRPVLNLPLIDRVFRTKSKITVTDEYTPLILIQPTILTQQQVEQQVPRVKPEPIDPNDPLIEQLEERLRR